MTQNSMHIKISILLLLLTFAIISGCTPTNDSIQGAGNTFGEMPEKSSDNIPSGVRNSIKVARKVADSWLNIVDSGDYSLSWSDSAAFLQKVVPKKNWIKGIESVRAPLGKLISRKCLSAQYATQLPNTPKGQYVVLHYKAQFENKTITETVTPMLDDDGKWRVSGYYTK